MEDMQADQPTAIWHESNRNLKRPNVRRASCTTDSMFSYLRTQRIVFRAKPLETVVDQSPPPSGWVMEMVVMGPQKTLEPALDTRRRSGRSYGARSSVERRVKRHNMQLYEVRYANGTATCGMR
uniref:Uncharacterized protein n=1 Tax=Anopheles atroparvus TaxID=41427 RepID=A0A182JCL8_ANOAO